MLDYFVIRIGRDRYCKLLTVWQPSTSILVSSSDHFFLGFFSWRKESSPVWDKSILRILPFFSGTSWPLVDEEAAWESKPVSSRKLQAWTTRGDDCDASDTRLCFKAEAVTAPCTEDGEEEVKKGALKEKVEVDGTTEDDGNGLIVVSMTACRTIQMILWHEIGKCWGKYRVNEANITEKSLLPALPNVKSDPNASLLPPGGVYWNLRPIIKWIKNPDTPSCIVLLWQGKGK